MKRSSTNRRLLTDNHWSTVFTVYVSLLTLTEQNICSCIWAMSWCFAAGAQLCRVDVISTGGGPTGWPTSASLSAVDTDLSQLFKCQAVGLRGGFFKTLWKLFIQVPLPKTALSSRRVLCTASLATPGIFLWAFKFILKELDQYKRDVVLLTAFLVTFNPLC